MKNIIAAIILALGLGAYGVTSAEAAGHSKTHYARIVNLHIVHKLDALPVCKGNTNGFENCQSADHKEASYEEDCILYFGTKKHGIWYIEIYQADSGFES